MNIIIIIRENNQQLAQFIRPYSELKEKLLYSNHKFLTCFLDWLTNTTAYHDKLRGFFYLTFPRLKNQRWAAYSHFRVHIASNNFASSGWSNTSSKKYTRLKGPCHKNFNTLLSKNSTWARPIGTGNNGFAKFTATNVQKC